MKSSSKDTKRDLSGNSLYAPLIRETGKEMFLNLKEICENYNL